MMNIEYLLSKIPSCLWSLAAIKTKGNLSTTLHTSYNIPNLPLMSTLMHSTVYNFIHEDATFNSKVIADSKNMEMSKKKIIVLNLEYAHSWLMLHPGCIIFKSFVNVNVYSSENKNVIAGLISCLSLKYKSEFEMFYLNVQCCGWVKVSHLLFSVWRNFQKQKENVWLWKSETSFSFFFP